VPQEVELHLQVVPTQSGVSPVHPVQVLVTQTPPMQLLLVPQESLLHLQAVPTQSGVSPVQVGVQVLVMQMPPRQALPAAQEEPLHWQTVPWQSGVSPVHAAQELATQAPATQDLPVPQENALHLQAGVAPVVSQTGVSPLQAGEQVAAALQWPVPSQVSPVTVQAPQELPHSSFPQFRVPQLQVLQTLGVTVVSHDSVAPQQAVPHCLAVAHVVEPSLPAGLPVSGLLLAGPGHPRANKLRQATNNRLRESFMSYFLSRRSCPARATAVWLKSSGTSASRTGDFYHRSRLEWQGRSLTARGGSRLAA
jgi:hypothetical protein